MTNVNQEKQDVLVYRNGEHFTVKVNVFICQEIFFGKTEGTAYHQVWNNLNYLYAKC